MVTEKTFSEWHVDTLAERLWNSDGYHTTLGPWPPQDPRAAAEYRTRADRLLQDVLATGIAEPATLTPVTLSDIDELTPIDPQDPRSAATQIADALRTAIAAGLYGPGDLLPSQPALASWYGVARDTVKSALRTLTTEGLIYGRRGSGTFVRAGAGDLARAAPRDTAALAAELAQLRSTTTAEFAQVTAMLGTLLARAGEDPAHLDAPGTLLQDLVMRPSEIDRLLTAAKDQDMSPGEFVRHAVTWRCHDILGPAAPAADD